MWLKWVLITLIALEPLAKVFMIDKPREPITKKDVALVMVVNAALIVGILHYWRQG